MNRSKAKGTAFERAVADFLALSIPGVDRKALHGGRDHGDIAGVANWTLECKSLKALDLAAAIDEARVEAKNAGTPHFAAVVKRRGKGVSQAYFVLPLDQAVRLLGGG